MGRITLRVFSFWVFIFVVVFLAGARGNGGAGGAGEESKPSFAEVVLSRVFSSSVSTSPPATVSYWDKVRGLLTHVRGHFYSPNVDFRGVDDAEAGEEGGGGGVGGGGKVKDAVSKSLEKSVETVEDSAKSAAKIASETVKKTKEKVKKSLLGRGSEDGGREL